MNILILSAGRRVQLFHLFEEALHSFDASSRVWAGDAHPEWSAVCAITKNVVELPIATSPLFIDHLKEFCIINEIAIVIPTIDIELQVLACNKALFHSFGTTLLLSEEKVINTFRNKLSTIEFFKQKGITVPKLYTETTAEYPIFFKPIDGSNSQKIGMVPNATYAYPALWTDDSLLKMEYFDSSHQEFSIDMYFDRNSQLRCAVPRWRVAVRGGEINNGQTVRNGVYDFVWKYFSQLPGAIGCITLQVFYHPIADKVIGIEINPRFGGGYPMSHDAGANFPKWIIMEYIFGELIPVFENWTEGMRYLRYDTHIGKNAQ